MVLCMYVRTSRCQQGCMYVCTCACPSVAMLRYQYMYIDTRSPWRLHRIPVLSQANGWILEGACLTTATARIRIECPEEENP